MADSAYASASGFIQFDPVEREANGQKVVDITIKTEGVGGKLIRVTVWPELQSVKLEKGDYVAVDGKLTMGTFRGRDDVERQSVQISATALAVVKGVKRTERGVANKDTAKSLPF